MIDPRLTMLSLNLYREASRSCQHGCVVVVVDGEERVAPCDYHSAWLNGMVALLSAASDDR
jgi:hypothetical protein